MNTLVKFGVAALAATLAAGSAMAATATPAKTAPQLHHHHAHHHAKLAHKHAKHHAHVAHMRKHHVNKIAHAKPVASKAAPAKVAIAKPLHAAGKIQRINAKMNTVTINHRVYRLAPQVASSSFKRGQKVQIMYRKGHGHRMIDKISAVSA